LICESAIQQLIIVQLSVEAWKQADAAANFPMTCIKFNATILVGRMLFGLASGKS
jgi:hypothetical protein